MKEKQIFGMVLFIVCFWAGTNLAFSDWWPIVGRIILLFAVGGSLGWLVGDYMKTD